MRKVKKEEARKTGKVIMISGEIATIRSGGNIYTAKNQHGLKANMAVSFLPKEKKGYMAAERVEKL